MIFLGVASIDQALFGFTVGIWIGLFSHFFIRDHIIKHIEYVLEAQNLLNNKHIKQSKKRDKSIKKVIGDGDNDSGSDIESS
jgi:hypothetical protein